MVEKNAGHVVNIGSVAGITVYPKGNVYCASKFAVDAITQGTNIDLAGTNIRVTEIDPGATLTNFTLTRFHGDQEKSDKSYEGYQPMGGVDIARAIMFALESPPNVNIQRIVMTPTAQRNPYVIAKKL
jgi:NADP-dependent 3-hydroxy acid dehydrogenase YdfG